jgi:prepilin peptidase CpaA
MPELHPFMPQLHPFHWSLLAVGLLLAAVTDVRRRVVPNWVTVGLLFSGLLARGLSAGPAAAAWGLAGAAVALLLLLYPFARSWIGGGDVKLLAACGAWLGPLPVLLAVIFSAAAGGAISVGCFLRSPRPVRRRILTNLKVTLMSRSAPAPDHRPPRLSPPMAPAIAAGTLLVVLDYVLLA